MSVMKPPFGSSTDLSQARDRLAGVAFEAIWERDLDNDALSWDENLESIFGYRRDEVASQLGWWRERVHPDDHARVEQTAADATRGDAPGWSNEYRFRRKDGSWAWVASRCVIERDAQGRARRAPRWGGGRRPRGRRGPAQPGLQPDLGAPDHAGTGTVCQE